MNDNIMPIHTRTIKQGTTRLVTIADPDVFRLIINDYTTNAINGIHLGKRDATILYEQLKIFLNK